MEQSLQPYRKAGAVCDGKETRRQGKAERANYEVFCTSVTCTSPVLFIPTEAQDAHVDNREQRKFLVAGLRSILQRGSAVTDLLSTAEMIPCGSTCHRPSPDSLGVD